MKKEFKAVDFVSCSKCAMNIGGITTCLHKTPCRSKLRKDKKDVMFLKI